jgi:hypothetical protein
LLKSPISRAVLLAGACLAAITPFFWWGNPSGHDFEFHVFSWMEVLGQWKNGILYPRWAALAHWGYGEARFLFYPPASWALGAALGAALPWKMVPGVYCWIALMLAGTGMYRLAREWFPAPDALFAAMFFALNPYHLLIVYWRSDYAELLAAALLPVLLLCLLRLFLPGSDPGLRPAICLSLTLAAACLTNLPAAVTIYYSTAGLALVLAAIGAVRETGRERWLDPQVRGRQIWSPQIWRPLVWTALAMLLGASLASFYLLPAIYEQGWVNLSEVLSLGVRPQDNFLFTTLADPAHNRFNLLVSTIAIAEIGVLAFTIWFSRRKKHVATAAPSTSSGQALGGRVARSSTGLETFWMLLSAWGAGSALLMLSVTNLFWQHLPKLRFVQHPFRWLLCMNAALAMLLTMSTKRWTSRALASAVLLCAVILAGYRFQRPWWEKASDILAMGDAVTDGAGYEGTDEYVPAGADPYELNKNLPRVSADTGAPVQSDITAWRQTEKHFSVHAAAPQDITVRLFNYPAWNVVVNGKPTETQTTDVTGLIVIPMAGGNSDVHIHLRRTIDRVIGDIVSLISLALLVVAWFKTRPSHLRPANIASPAA